MKFFSLHGLYKRLKKKRKKMNEKNKFIIHEMYISLASYYIYI